MKKGKLLGLVLLSMVMLTGCIDYMPDLTEEESALISEYAAGLLLKYSPNYDYMLVSDDELAEALGQEELYEESAEASAQAEAIEQEEASEAEAESGQKPETETSVSDESTASHEEAQLLAADADIAEALGLGDSISIKYQSYEICDSYPQNSTGFNGIDASEGKKLLVLHFDLASTAGEDIECDLYDDSLKISATIGEASYISAEDTSMFPNDLAAYIGTVLSDAVEDVVAVIQIDEDAESNIDSSSLSVRITSTDGSCEIMVK